MQPTYGVNCQRNLLRSPFLAAGFRWSTQLCPAHLAPTLELLSGCALLNTHFLVLLIWPDSTKLEQLILRNHGGSVNVK